MKFILRWASNWDYEEKISLNSIEEIKELSKKVGHKLIFNFTPVVGDIPEIMVYDDWLE